MWLLRVMLACPGGEVNDLLGAGAGMGRRPRRVGPGAAPAGDQAGGTSPSATEGPMDRAGRNQAGT